MRITVRVGLEASSVPALRRHPDLERLLAPALEVSAFPWLEVDAESAAFDRVVAEGAGGPGFRYTPMVDFGAAEVEQAEWLDLDCGKFLVEGKADFRYNSARRAAAPWVLTGPARAHRVLRDLSLARVKLRAGEVATVAEWIEEWAVPTSVVRLCETAGLRGFSTRPLLAAAQGKAHEDFVQWDTEHVFPPLREGPGFRAEGLLAEDPLVPEGEVEDSPAPAGARKYRVTGCGVYGGAVRLPPSDFARTAEALSAWGQPSWVVSGRVRAVFASHKLRGARFRPLLAEGSPAHAEYVKKWQAFEERVARNPANRLW